MSSLPRSPTSSRHCSSSPLPATQQNSAASPIPIEGISLRPAFTGRPIAREMPIFIEHQKNAFIREGDWKLVGKGLVSNTAADADKWELYNLATDRTELDDLSTKNPGKRRELASAWHQWAKRVGVFKGNGERGKKENSQRKTGWRSRHGPLILEPGKALATGCHHWANRSSCHSWQKERIRKRPR